MEPFIYFAGEHVDVDYFGSIHGAYMSGNAAADKIIESIVKKQQKSTKQRSNNTKDLVGKQERHIAPSASVNESSVPHSNLALYSLLLLIYGYEFIVRT